MSLKEVLAEAIRIEIEEKTGKVFLVFEIKSEKLKREIITKWKDDIDFRLIDKSLIAEESEK